MTENQMQDFIAEAIETFDADAETVTFEEGGVLTMNKGLTVTMADGTEFQITIVQSA